MMMIHCGKAVKRVGMFGVSVRKMQALTVKKETAPLVGKVRQNLICFVYQVYEINRAIFFLADVLIFGGVILD